VIACDHIWFSKNKAYHEDLVPNALTISAHINSLVLEHSSAWKTSLSRSPEVWKRPCSPFIKINYDTAIRDSFSAQAAVIRDSTGTITHCSSLISPPCTAVYGEALAALLASNLPF
jgi:hypothetical protein